MRDHPRPAQGQDGRVPQPDAACSRTRASASGVDRRTDTFTCIDSAPVTGCGGGRKTPWGRARSAIATGDFDGNELAVFFFNAGDLANDELHVVVVAHLLHFGDAGRRGTEAIAAVYQDYAFGLVGAFGGKV